jgi:hypothetical protein
VVDVRLGTADVCREEGGSGAEGIGLGRRLAGILGATVGGVGMRCAGTGREGWGQSWVARRGWIDEIVTWSGGVSVVWQNREGR